MNRKNNSKTMKGKGFYAAILLCIAGVIVASFAALNGLLNAGEEKLVPQENKTTAEENNEWGLDDFIDEPVEKPAQNIQISSSQSSAQQNGQYSPSEQSDSLPVQENVSQLPVASAPQFVRPTETAVTKPFSGEELVFNETMQDWRTHNGADYAAKKGDAVTAIISGTVIEIKTDTVWGSTVKVEGDGYIVTYAGLESVKAKEGVNVVAGETIGKAAGEICAEVGDGEHIHIEVEQDGRLIDPEALFNA